MTRPIYLFVALCLACLCGPAVAEIYVVNPVGTGDYATIQAAVGSVSDGDVIELTDGTYTGDGNRDILFGGRAVTLRSQSGNPEACVIDCQGSLSEPHRGFIFQDGETSSSVLEGITITGAWVGTSCGGAMIIRNASSPSIVNCRFVENSSDCVGAIYINFGSPTITDCLFQDNTCGVNCDGGAVFVSGGNSPILDGCRFIGNSSPKGGALIARFTATPTVTNCLFAENSADMLGGALVCEDDAIVIVENCTFVGNDAPSGGAILIRENASLTVTNSIIASSVNGEAVACEGAASANLSCCDVWDNAGGDWVGCIAGLDGVDGNFSTDPCFCLDSYYIAETSACASANNACSVLIGALDEQCVDCGGEVPTQETTWGQLKAGYR